MWLIKHLGDSPFASVGPHLKRNSLMSSLGLLRNGEGGVLDAMKTMLHMPLCGHSFICDAITTSKQTRDDCEPDDW